MVYWRASKYMYTVDQSGVYNPGEVKLLCGTKGGGKVLVAQMTVSFHAVWILFISTMLA